MFDIGFQELVLIFIVALLVFGPEKLPEIGKTLAKWMVEIRRGIQNAKNQMESEFEEIEKRQSSSPDLKRADETKQVQSGDTAAGQERREGEQGQQDKTEGEGKG